MIGSLKNILTIKIMKFQKYYSHSSRHLSCSFQYNEFETTDTSQSICLRKGSLKWNWYDPNLELYEYAHYIG